MLACCCCCSNCLTSLSLPTLLHVLSSVCLFVSIANLCLSICMSVLSNQPSSSLFPLLPLPVPLLPIVVSFIARAVLASFDGSCCCCLICFVFYVYHHVCFSGAPVYFLFTLLCVCEYSICVVPVYVRA